MTAGHSSCAIRRWSSCFYETWGSTIMPRSKSDNNERLCYNGNDENRPRLPLRWAVILCIGSAVGIFVGVLGMPVAGVPAGIAAAAALDKLIG